MTEPQGTKLQELEGSETKTKDEAASPDADKELKYELSWNSRSPILRCLFVLCVVMIFGGFVFHMYQQFSKYLNYPVIAIREEALQGVPFPDVAICHISYIDNQRNLVHKVSGNSYRETFFQSNMRDIIRLLESNDTNPDHYQGFSSYAYMPIGKEAFLPLMASSNIGVKMDDIMINCQYEGRNCDFRNFTNVLHPEHGTCAVFSPKTASTFLSGQEFGLFMNLVSTGKRLIDARLAMTSYVVAFKIFLLPRGTWPDLTSGLFVPPFERLSIQFSYSTLTKLSTPRSPCSARRYVSLCRLEVGSGLVCRQFLDTASARRAVSKQESLVRRCGCVSFSWPIPVALRASPACLAVPPAALVHSGFRREATRLVVDASNTPLADLMDLATARRRLHCYLAEKAKEKEADAKWSGERPCNSQTYATENVRGKHHFSYVSYNSNNKVLMARLEQVKEDLERVQKISKAAGVTSTLTILDPSDQKVLHALEKAGAQVKVFAEAPSSLVIKEYYLYDVLFFLADTGGVLGLWVGFSLFTLLEIADWGVGKTLDRRRAKKE